MQRPFRMLSRSEGPLLISLNLYVGGGAPGVEKLNSADADSEAPRRLTQGGFALHRTGCSQEDDQLLGLCGAEKSSGNTVQRTTLPG